MFEGWFPSVEELDAYQRRRREEREERNERNERIDALVSEFMVQLHATMQLPLAELASPLGTGGSTDPTSVMDTFPDLD